MGKKSPNKRVANSHYKLLWSYFLAKDKKSQTLRQSMDDEEQLLYGEGNEGNDEALRQDEASQEESQVPTIEEEPEPTLDVLSEEDTSHDKPNEDSNMNDEDTEAQGGGDEEEDDSDEDDNLQIIIDQGKIEEAKTSMQTFGITKSARNLLSEKKGKFSVEDFDRVGKIDGAPAQEVDLESLEDKPWRKPGADITDYFNYGFTEETWAAYCSRQKRIRINESGAGLPNNPSSSTNVSNTMSSFGMKSQNGGTIPTLGNQGIKRLGTSDQRDFSKKMFEKMDFSVPPPGMNVPPPSIPPPNFSAPPPSSGEDFDPAAEDQYDYYGGGYEPTQESQWVAPPSTYVGGSHPNSDAPPGDIAYDDKRDPWQRNGQGGSGGRRTSRESPSRDRKRRRSRSRSREHRYRESRDYRDSRRDRDPERPRDRERRDRDRERDRDRDRDRKRSRSPRDSRSPSTSSHKHKKSKRDKREKSEKPEKDIKKEVKEEPEDYVE